MPVGTSDAIDVKVAPPPSPQAVNNDLHVFPAVCAGGPPPAAFMVPTMPATTVYNYVNPLTGDVVSCFDHAVV